MGMSKQMPVEEVRAPAKASVAEEPQQGDVSKKTKKRKLQEEEAAPVDPEVEAEPKLKKSKSKTDVEQTSEPATGMDAAAFRAKHLINSNTEKALPDPIQSFDLAPFGKKVRNACKEMGFLEPTAIQAQGWPVAANGDDLVSVAKTGSGKTLCFLLPVFRKIQKEALDPSDGPVALVLAPTRELATQIEEVAVKFGACMDIKTTILFGGVPKPPQAKALKARPHLVVATPGRLMDLMNDGSVKLGNVTSLILDEADRMLDMGFEPQMDKVMVQVPKERQTMLFSATWPKSVQKLASKYLKKDSVNVNVGETEDLAANKSVSQEFYKLDDDEKENKLWKIMSEMGEGTKIMVFANTKNRINQLQKKVWANGWDCVAMHGDKTQPERDAGLAKFVSAEIPIMLATDVCARGLDIKDVTHVLNFDMARDVESYIHRIGRTGRAGKSGVSITFVNHAYDTECAPALAKIAREAGQPVPEFLEKLAEKGKNMKNKQWKY